MVPRLGCSSGRVPGGQLPPVHSVNKHPVKAQNMWLFLLPAGGRQRGRTPAGRRGRAVERWGGGCGRSMFFCLESLQGSGSGESTWQWISFGNIFFGVSPSCGVKAGLSHTCDLHKERPKAAVNGPLESRVQQFKINFQALRFLKIVSCSFLYFCDWGQQSVALCQKPKFSRNEPSPNEAWCW